MKPRRVAMAALLIVAALGFATLGIWQFERRAWKLDLIARVDARLAAAPVAVPHRADWSSIAAERNAYTRVKVSGTFIGKDSFVQASTVLGPGYWVLTPLRTPQGDVLVNRGYIPQVMQATFPMPASRRPAEVTGLLRITEPGGSVLRANVPASDRWYSRDVAAIAARRGLPDVAPFFIDADAGPEGGKWPRGGLTVVRFANNHLIYGLTWFGLAALALWALVTLQRMREEP